MAKNFATPDSVHFIGIGGTGMRPLAEIALARGYQVSGSDQIVSPSTEQLCLLGASITIGHKTSALPNTANRVVVSSAIQKSNPELDSAQDRGLQVLHRSEFLRELMQGQQAICVSGTHGKTSTTAMLAFMLQELGLDPTAAIGGELVGSQRYSMSGQGRYFVAECDESDGSFTCYEPFLSIVTNIDLDHLDYYHDLDGLKRGFLSFVKRTQVDGCAIFGWDNSAAREIAHLFTGQRLSFGTKIGCEIRGLNFKSKGCEATYEAVVEKQQIKGVIPLVGRHNLQNVLCCLAVASNLDLDIHLAAIALSRYPGVKRRFSLVAEIGNLKIFDDYAHNPGKIKSCLDGAREAFPSDRIIVIFQPHRYSRLETMYNETMAAFSAADEVFTLPVYAAGETSQRDFSPATLADGIKHGSQIAARAYDETTLDRLLRENSQPTVLVTIGAGDVSELSQRWKDCLHDQKKSPKETS